MSIRHMELYDLVASMAPKPMTSDGFGDDDFRKHRYLQSATSIEVTSFVWGIQPPGAGMWAPIPQGTPWDEARRSYPQAIPKPRTQTASAKCFGLSLNMRMVTLRWSGDQKRSLRFSSEVCQSRPNITRGDACQRATSLDLPARAGTRRLWAPGAELCVYPLTGPVGILSTCLTPTPRMHPL
jgi:hypothetical protein